MPPLEHEQELRATAAALAGPRKGILAADESVGTIGKRLTALRLQNTPENRRRFRELLLTAPNNHRHLSGVILFHETFYQATAAGEPFVAHLRAKNVLPGIKVDTGLKPAPHSPRETYTSGLPGLPDRCRAYYADGARFAKWRAALRVDPHLRLPSAPVVAENAATLARYARVAQEAGLVPIVEPEILIDGAHSQDESAAVARRVIAACYDALRKEDVLLPATLLKPMMVMPGVDSPDRAAATPELVARATLDVMADVVPPDVPGIMFLSGGMSEEQATRNLNALNRLAQQRGNVPWSLSFSFGRALQTSAMDLWQGKDENKDKAGIVAAELAAANASAVAGEFDGKHPSTSAAESLYEGFRGWRSGEDPKGV